MTKAIQTAQRVGIPEFRLKDNRRMQILQEPALPRNPELVRKIAPDAGNDLESYLIERLHSEIIEKINAKDFANDPVFKVLQNEVKLCNFSSRYLMHVDMSDFDRAVAKREEKEEIAKGLLKDGVPMEIIVRNTGLSEEAIRKL